MKKLFFTSFFLFAILFKTNFPTSIVKAVTLEPSQDCQSDNDCSNGQICYQPQNCNPDGTACTNAILPRYCKTPDPSPTPTPPAPNSECMSDADCSSGLVCNHPPQNCNDDGTACTNMMTLGYCKTPDPSPTSTPLNCQTSNDCSIGQACYQPPMPPCPKGLVCTQAMPQKYCKLMNADLNGDGKVNIQDFTILSSQFMTTGSPLGDINSDGKVDLKDFTIMMLEFNVI